MDGPSVKGSWIWPKLWKHFSFYNVIRYDASVEIDAIGYRMLQGHRIVLNISCSYWPMIWTPRRCTNISFRKAHLSLPIIHNLEEAEDTVCQVTLQKWEVHAWWNDCRQKASNSIFSLNEFAGHHRGKKFKA